MSALRRSTRPRTCGTATPPTLVTTTAAMATTAPVIIAAGKLNRNRSSELCPAGWASRSGPLAAVFFPGGCGYRSHDRLGKSAAQQRGSFAGGPLPLLFTHLAID